MKSLYQRLEAICAEVEKLLAAQKKKPATLYVRRDIHEGHRWHLHSGTTGERVFGISAHNLTRGEVILEFERMGFQNITSD